MKIEFHSGGLKFSYWWWWRLQSLGLWITVSCHLVIVFCMFWWSLCRWLGAKRAKVRRAHFSATSIWNIPAINIWNITFNTYPTNLALISIRYPWHFLSEFFGQAPIKKRNVSPFRSKHFIQILTLALMLLVMNKVFVCLFYLSIFPVLWQLSPSSGTQTPFLSV